MCGCCAAWADLRPVPACASPSLRSLTAYKPPMSNLDDPASCSPTRADDLPPVQHPAHFKGRHRLGTALVALQFALIGGLALLALPAFLRGHAPAGAWGVAAAGALLGLWALSCNRPGNFNIRPTPRAGGQLVQRGPYRWIRHPMYSAVMACGLACAWVGQFPLGMARRRDAGGRARDEGKLRRTLDARRAPGLCRLPEAHMALPAGHRVVDGRATADQRLRRAPQRVSRRHPPAWTPVRRAARRGATSPGSSCER